MVDFKKFRICYGIFVASVFVWLCILVFVDYNYVPCVSVSFQQNVTATNESNTTGAGADQQTTWRFNCSAESKDGRRSNYTIQYGPCYLDHCVEYKDALYALPAQNGLLIEAADLWRVQLGGFFGIMALSLVALMVRKLSNSLNRPLFANSHLARFEVSTNGLLGQSKTRTRVDPNPDVAFAVVVFAPGLCLVLCTCYSVMTSMNFAFGWAFLPAITYVPLFMFTYTNTASSTSSSSSSAVVIR